MFDTIRQLFRPKADLPQPAIPAGQRVYAVGDIHGRLDLFATLIAGIEADDGARPRAETTIILLGDLVDRGPDSAAVIAAARDLANRRRVRIIAGNHEEMFLDSFEKADVLRHFLRHGGRETILSYPIAPDIYRDLTLDETRAMLPSLVPDADIAFLRSFEDMIAIGDYLFVHAGIRPGLPLDQQHTRELRWIREPFLSSADDHGFCVVHGHSITEEPEVRANRIGIDTGAFMSGRLTALGLQGTERWFLETEEADGTVQTRQRALA